VPVDRPHLDVGSRAELRAWLEANHATSDGAWFVRHRKGTERHVPYGDVVEELLCFGWIDGHARPLDDTASLLLVTPRRGAKSRWSKVNRDRIARLEAAGLLTEAGTRAVADAKASGAWTALDRAESLVEPDDLAAALDAVPAARQAWDGFPPSVRKGLLQWVFDAKRDETRHKRVRLIVDEAAEGRRANEWRPKG
jgi:uncharacterized protein YdeI (YjbR/CyaY-like superfamily)